MVTKVKPTRQLAELAEHPEDTTVQVEFHDAVVVPVGHEQPLVFGDVEAPRGADMVPLPQKIPVAVENLDAEVFAVSDVDQPFLVNGYRVRDVELALSDTFLPPGFEELPVFRELDDARVTVAVTDIEIPVRGNGDVGGTVEAVWLFGWVTEAAGVPSALARLNPSSRPRGCRHRRPIHCLRCRCGRRGDG